MSGAIAVVGLACRYPDAGSPQDLWENVLAQRRAFRRLPEERLSSADYFSADPATPDAVYSLHAAVIEGYEFDRSRFKVAGNSYRAADLTHWLALDVADQALRDAGFPDGEGLPRQATGVLVGNTLTGEFSRAALMRLRWPYVRRVVDKQLADEGWDGARRRGFLEALEDAYKAPFPAFDEDTLAGGLSNTISGRICNHFHLGGGGYTVDGACSSSLLAVAHGCTALASGDLDVAIAGGVDLSLDPFELVGFCKAGALSRTQMRVYDRDAAGFWPGEGCGMVVLMRLQDALARGLRCYALIRGWGISSDGGGGITRPEIDGQRLAIERAYRRAGFGADTVELFEGHGTGTALGDEVELRALALVRRDARRRAAIGSIKANIGHTKAAAGAAGLIKAAMALHTQIIPPNSGLDNPRPELESGLFRAVLRAQAWPADRPLRTGVSAFGFGGINVHLALEGASATRRAALTMREHALASSAQDAEVFLIGAADRNALLERLKHLAGIAARLSYAELGDLAAALTEWSGPQRAALVAASPAQLQTGLDALIERLQSGDDRRLDPDAGLFAGRALHPPRIAFLFPGQAAPVYPEGGALARRFEAAREIYARAALPAGSSATTGIAQPAIIAAELAALRILAHFGIEAGVAVGHSVGEIAALHWAGALSAEATLELARERGRIMNDVPGPPGAMVSVAAAAASVARLLEPDVVIACYNAERHTVLSGEARAVAEAADRCRAAGMHVTSLPVSHAFHSPLMAPAGQDLRDYLAGVELAPLKRRVVSTVTGSDLEPREDLRSLLVRQLTEPVRFERAIKALAGAQLCIEAGPGAVLTHLARMAVSAPVIALDAGGPSLGGLLRAIGASFVLGAPVDREAVFSGRLRRPFALDWRPRFFANPCELAPTSSDAPFSRAPRPAEPRVQAAPSEAPAEPLELVRSLVATRAELPLSAIASDSRLLMDLHLNSLAVGQLVAAAARALGLAPPISLLDYADATVGEIAMALAERRALGGSAPGEPESERHPAGVDAWVRAFVVDDIECPLPAPADNTTAGGPWRVFAAQDDPLARRIGESLTADRGPGVLVCVGEERDPTAIARLLQAARCALETGGRFVLVNHGGACGASLARTLHAEAPALAICVVHTPADAAPGRVLAEIDAGTGYRETRYDTAGRRSERRLRVLPLTPGSGSLPLASADVLLVTGGGKGIGAECALALAKETGARLAIVGRSDPQSDRELEGNLRRLSDAGLVWRYYRADVADREALEAVVLQVAAELDPVTSLLHAAGVNRPALLRDLDAEKIQATFSPKVEGLRNLFAALREQPLRLLVSFGSIIARVGMRGEADYALANEALADRVQQYADDHPDCRCLNLEWSVWSGAGMGERLGRIDAMLAEGIAPISIDAGVAWLKHLVANPPRSVSVVVAGRFGETPVLRQDKPELPFLRFVERPRIFYPGIELVVEAELTPASDPYLDDHMIGGERLFPAVMGLEAMAQVAMAVLGRTDRPGFDRIELTHPITVAADHPETLRIAALVRGSAEVEVVLRCSSNAFQVDHFRARCRFGEDLREEMEPGPQRAAAALDRGRDLYGNLFFHGGRFRRVHAYRHLRATECGAEIATADASAWFGRYLPAALVLGDPGLRDAALHSIQACIPHVRVLPVAVERIRSAAVDAPGPWVARAKERSHDAVHYIYDFDLVAADGRISERWEGVKLRRVGPLELKTWPAALLVPYLERRVGELLPGAQFGAALDVATSGTRRERSERAMQSALGHKAGIRYRADGKPEINGAGYLSAAHAGDITLAVAGARRVACDIEWIDPARETGDLLGPESQVLADAIAAQALEEPGDAAIRVWSALECLKKAGAVPGTPISLAACERDGWIVLNAGDLGIATCITALGEPSARAVVAILAEHPQACAHTNTGT